MVKCEISILNTKDENGAPMNDVKRHQGFTLIEMMLVLVIVSALLMMFINLGLQRTDQFLRDKTITQIQLALNAALAYYTTYGKWPGGYNAGDQFIYSDPNYAALLPTGFNMVPYTNATPERNYRFRVPNNANGLLFELLAPMPPGASGAAIASIIAGSVPGGYVGAGNYVIARITVPGQNLNNARSVNFTSIYSHNGCVPAPVCPGWMKPQIYVAAVSVAGIANNPTGCGAKDPTGAPTCPNVDVYPLHAFTAYVIPSAPTAKPLGCNNAPTLCATNSNDLPTTTYWRACLQVTTSKGVIAPVSDNQGLLMGKILAITRCVPADQTGTITESPKGSGINVWEAPG